MKSTSTRAVDARVLPALGPAQRLSSQASLAAVLVFLPWVSPFAPGPSPSVAPWLATATCGSLLGMLAALRGGRPSRGLLLSLALFAGGAAVLTGMRPEVAMLAGGLALIAIASSVPAEDGPGSMGRALQQAWLAAASVSAAIALLQYLGLASVLQPFVNGAQPGEAYGNLRQPNLFASLCSLGLAVLLWGGVRLPLRAALPLAMLVAAGSAASVSRTGAVQGLMLGVLALWWGGPERRRRLALWAAAAGAYLLASWLLPILLEAMTGTVPARTLWGRVSGNAIAACSSRTVLWNNVLHLIAQHPLAGWGWGELDRAHFLTLYGGPRFCDILDNAHNLPLHLAVELGVPFAVLACGFAAWWAWRQRPWAEQASLRQLAWAVLAVILVHSLLEYPLWYGPFQVAFGVAVGWLLPRTEAAPARLPRRWAAALGLLLAGVAYAGWDYARVSQIYRAPEARLAPWREDTLGHVRQSWLFSGQGGFADLTLAEVTSKNVHWAYPLAQQVLHYSPEPRVVERLIESESLLGRTDDAVLDLARYRAAFPNDYAAWRASVRQALPAPPP